jgi:hypothetical protein
MSNSNAYTAIAVAADSIRHHAGALHQSTPQVAHVLGAIASELQRANETIELARIESILSGTHSALQPLRRQFEMSSLNTDLSIVLPIDEDDTLFSASPAAVITAQRALGCIFRNLYKRAGICENSQKVVFSEGSDCSFSPNGYSIEKHDIVLEWLDSNAAFRHTLRLNNLFLTMFGNNVYSTASLWMNETISMNIMEIGEKWFNTHVIAAFCDSFGIKPSDYISLDRDVILPTLLALEDTHMINQNSVFRMEYPGDEDLHISCANIMMTVTGYPCQVDRKVNIYVTPVDKFHLWGLTGQGTRNIGWDEMPTAVQQYILDHLEESYIALKNAPAED